MSAHRINLSGQRHGSVIVTENWRKTSNRGTQWLVRCDCGFEWWSWAETIKREPDICCRECRKKVQRKNQTIHGGRYTKAWSVWKSMIGRCRNKNDENYHNYGGRGIDVCERWKSFSDFWTDMGDPPVGLSLGRKDNDKGYFK